MPTEADRWRKKAADALEKVTRYLEIILNAVAQLIKVSEIHQSDNFNHCKTCHVPWPCATATIIRDLVVELDKFKKE